MRSLIRHLITRARREARTNPAAPLCIEATPHGRRLADDAIRLARLATAAHLDQATRLRAEMARLEAPPAPPVRTQSHSCRLPQRVFTARSPEVSS